MSWFAPCIFSILVTSLTKRLRCHSWCDINGDRYINLQEFSFNFITYHLFLFVLSGDFISTKSQNEVIAADLKIEKEEHFVHHREVEEQQVAHSSEFRHLYNT
jgi:hypothetical protein